MPNGNDPNDPNNPMTNVTIIDDDDITIGFEREMYTATEDEGTQEVCVGILEGRLSRSVTVFLESRDLSAQGMFILYSLPVNPATFQVTLLNFEQKRECLIDY